ncbi:MAG: hypothetical protein NTW03_03770 [Verrucomicrobia bacterium]|nr:hypothetical protein [Verrucomicrobiota bacterium]
MEELELEQPLLELLLELEELARLARRSLRIFRTCGRGSTITLPVPPMKMAAVMVFS